MSDYQYVQVETNEQSRRFCTASDLPLLEAEAVAWHNADSHWMLADSADRVAARCSLWWQTTPTYPDHRVGLIGHYGAVSAADGHELLRLACRQLATKKCTLAVGPMDGSSWFSYRFITERGPEPTFLMEPNNPDDWPDHFFSQGFTPLARYVSTVNTDLARNRTRLTRVAQRAEARGIRLRPFNPDCFEAELRQIYTVALASFAQNFLYSPISEPDFLALYQPLRAYIQPELILIAERAGQTIGFIFALPDYLQAQRRVAVDTIIIKTVAVHPDHQLGGLGSLLVARCQEIAHDLGYKRAVHALMHASDDSRKISHRHQTRTIRHYALMAKTLSGIG